ncbi:MAG TPA: outer membrane beta-barrel protein, partial [Terriglobales bacterium]|nr:outer membrane beta-barrel protein [Terriglobales bacterium]
MNYGVDILIAVCALALAFFLTVLLALLRDMSRISRLSAVSPEDYGKEQFRHATRARRGDRVKERKHKWAAVIAIATCVASLQSQSKAADQTASKAETSEAMQERISKLEKEVSELKAVIEQLQKPSLNNSSSVQSDTVSDNKAAPEPQSLVQGEDRKALEFLRDTTINLGLDTYYAYNFNAPVGRVNLLRPYDVLSNEFSLNQASVILEHAPDLNAGRRWGARLDLQYGQA